MQLISLFATLHFSAWYRASQADFGAHTTDFSHRERNVQARVDIEADVRHELTRRRGNSGADHVNTASLRSMFERGASAKPVAPFQQQSSRKLTGLQLGSRSQGSAAVYQAHALASSSQRGSERRLTGLNHASSGISAAAARFGGARRQPASQNKGHVRGHTAGMADAMKFAEL